MLQKRLPQGQLESDFMAEKLVSIIILNWNGKQDTEQCIESIYKNTSYKNFEIVLVDNGSNDGSVEMLKKLQKCKKIHQLVLNRENNGFGGGNNQGMEVAKGDYLFLLNNDTFVTKNWLRNIVKVAESRKDIGIVGPHFPLVQDPEFVFGGGYTDDAGRAVNMYNRKDMAVEQVSGGAFLIKRELFAKIGFFDEGFFPIYFEEADYCARARKAGFKVFYTLKSKILHNEGAATSKQANKWRYVTINKNRIRFVLLHFPKTRLLKFFAWELLRFGKELVHLKVHWLLEAWIVNLTRLGEIIGKRKDYSKKELLVKAGR